jgi:hypothetical protein
MSTDLIFSHFLLVALLWLCVLSCVEARPTTQARQAVRPSLTPSAFSARIRETV